jgi:UDP-3-O-[3-hydroxymyristoyl] glucosamine N-acyltransferase
MNIAELARQTGARLEGDESIEIVGAAGLDIAEAGQITFLANKRYTPQVKTTRASAIYVGESVEVGRRDIVVLRAANPYLAYTRALRLFHPEPPFTPFIHPTAVVDSTARLDSGVWIGAHVFIGREVEVASGVRVYPNVTIYDYVSIGADSVIHSGVSLREGTLIGERVIIHNNTVVGSDGFGYAKDEQSRWLKIPQTGRVVVEDDVEIGAGTAIDKASVGETRIARGVKIDNLVQVGHSCAVGEDTLLCGQVGLAGSTQVGRRVILAGQVGVAGHLTIGDDVIMMAQSGTSHDIAAGKMVSGGVPAFEHQEALRSMVAFRRLPGMQRKLRALEQKVEALEKELAAARHTDKETA